MAGMEDFYRERDRDRNRRTANEAESESSSNEYSGQPAVAAGAGAGPGVNHRQWAINMNQPAGAGQYHYPQVAPPQYFDSPHPHLEYPDSNPAGLTAAGKRRVDPSAAKAQFSSHRHNAAMSTSPTSDRYAGLGFGITGLLTDYLVSHPFVVLRRTCQVNNASLRHHRTPFTLLPVVANLNRSQGLGCLWKGIGSTLVVRGLTLAAEDCTSKFTPWPKEVDRHSSLRMVGQHLLLKAVSLAVVTPFYSASLVETVQSEIASERPGILDVFREGFSRILNWSCPHSGRMLPVWLLMPSTVVHGVLHYTTFVITSSLSHTMIQRTYRQSQKARGAVAKVGIL